MSEHRVEIERDKLTLRMLQILLCNSKLNRYGTPDKFIGSVEGIEDIPFSEIKELYKQGMVFKDYSGYILINKDKISEELPEGYPDRMIPVYKTVLRQTTRDKKDEKGEVILEEVEDKYLSIKTNEDSISVMTNGEEEKLYSDVIDTYGSAQGWSTVFELVTVKRMEPVQEFYEIEERVLDLEKSKIKTFNDLDVANIVKSKIKTRVLIPFNKVGLEPLLELDKKSWCAVLSKKEGTEYLV